MMTLNQEIYSYTILQTWCCKCKRWYDGSIGNYLMYCPDCGRYRDNIRGKPKLEMDQAEPGRCPKTRWQRFKGWVTEWKRAGLLSQGRPKGRGGSNPSPSVRGSSLRRPGGRHRSGLKHQVCTPGYAGGKPRLPLSRWPVAQRQSARLLSGMSHVRVVLGQLGKGITYVFQQAYYERNKARYRETHTALREKKQYWLAEYKATLKCQKCGEDHPATLDFHHRDPAEKKISIGKAVAINWKTERILKEVAKCDVLCSNCHRKLHYELEKTPV